MPPTFVESSSDFRAPTSLLNYAQLESRATLGIGGDTLRITRASFFGNTLQVPALQERF